MLELYVMVSFLFGAAALYLSVRGLRRAWLRHQINGGLAELTKLAEALPPPNAAAHKQNLKTLHVLLGAASTAGDLSDTLDMLNHCLGTARRDTLQAAMEISPA